MRPATLENRSQPASGIEGEGDSPLPSSVACPDCGCRNPDSRRFCAQCGKSLWAECPKCGAEISVGDTFCGACGANLQDLARQRLRHYAVKLEEARRLLGECRYDEARSRLQTVATTAEPACRELAQQAQGLLETLDVQRQQAERGVEEALQQARKFLECQEYDLAAERLLAIPQTLRNPAVQETLRRAQASAAEYRALSAELAQAIQEKRLSGLRDTLERILELKPADEQALQFSQGLHTGVVAAAQKKLAEHAYGHALQLLEHVPAVVRDRKFEQLIEQARELQWLWNALQSAATVDRTLLTIAERLVAVAPTNTEAARLYEQLQQRALQPPSKPFHAAPDWSPPQSARYSCPVHGLSGLHRLAATPAAVSQLRTHPGRFFVALGLALQALERAPVGINLASAGPSGLWHKLSRRLSRPPRVAWGLDLGEAALKAVRLVCDDDGTMRVDAVELMEHAHGLAQAVDDSQRQELIKQTLHQMRERHPMDEARVYVSLPSHLAVIRAFRLPRIPKARLDEAIRLEARRQIPFPLEELRWDYTATPVGGAVGTGEAGWDVIVSGARESRVVALEKLYREASWEIQGVQSDGLALHNLIVSEHCRSGDGAGEAWPATAAIATLDVGASSSRLVISTPHSVWSRSLTVGSEAITNQLAKTYKLTRGQAEQLKQNPVASKRVSRWCESIQPLLDRLAEDLERALALYRRQSPDVQLRQLFGVGGGFAVHGLLRRLRAADSTT